MRDYKTEWLNNLYPNTNSGWIDLQRRRAMTTLGEPCESHNGQRVPCVPYPINRAHTNYLIDFYEYGKNTIAKSES